MAGDAGNGLIGIMKANIVIDGKTIIFRISDTIKDIFEQIIIVTNTPGEFGEYISFKIVVDQFRNVGPLGGIHSAMSRNRQIALVPFFINFISL